MLFILFFLYNCFGFFICHFLLLISKHLLISFPELLEGMVQQSFSNTSKLFSLYCLQKVKNPSTGWVPLPSLLSLLSLYNSIWTLFQQFPLCVGLFWKVPFAVLRIHNASMIQPFNLTTCIICTQSSFTCFSQTDPLGFLVSTCRVLWFIDYFRVFLFSYLSDVSSKIAQLLQLVFFTSLLYLHLMGIS